MTRITPGAEPKFWGKEALIPFVGCVEDVNDPKMSGRVKVRCVAWHPKSKKECKSMNECFPCHL